MVVSEYYPEIIQRKRGVKDHEEWGKIKSMILLELMKGPDTRSDLKLKINEQLKREGSLPITIKTVVRHLRNPDKTGLIDLGIVREKSGLLELSLTTPRKIAKFIDELSRNKTVGQRVSYFIDRIFAEAFFSPFGDRFVNSNRIYYYIEDQIEKELEKLAIRKYISDQLGEETVKKFKLTYKPFNFHQKLDPVVEEIVKKFKEFDIVVGWYYLISISIHRLIDSEGDKLVIEDINKYPSLASKKSLEIWKQMDVLSIILGASKEIRGNIDTMFKVSYVLMVINRIVLSRKAIKKEYEKIVNLMDFTVFQYPNSLILEFEPIGKILKEFILEKFWQLLKKAISGEFTIDRTFNKEFSILENPEDAIALKITESVYARKIGEMLSEPLIGEESVTREEARKLDVIRKQKGLSWHRFFIYKLSVFRFITIQVILYY